jgi:hypothetical protein
LQKSSNGKWSRSCTTLPERRRRRCYSSVRLNERSPVPAPVDAKPDAHVLAGLVLSGEAPTRLDRHSGQVLGCGPHVDDLAATLARRPQRVEQLEVVVRQQRCRCSCRQTPQDVDPRRFSGINILRRPSATIPLRCLAFDASPNSLGVQVYTEYPPWFGFTSSCVLWAKATNSSDMDPSHRTPDPTQSGMTIFAPLPRRVADRLAAVGRRHPRWNKSASSPTTTVSARLCRVGRAGGHAFVRKLRRNWKYGAGRWVNGDS